MGKKIAAWLFVLIIASLRTASGQGNRSERDFAHRVSDRLSITAPSVSAYSWLHLDPSNTVNAAATFDGSGRPIVMVTTGMLSRVIEGDADRLAYVVAHELAHHLLGHTTKATRRTPFARAIFERGEEIEADVKGMQLAIGAGYSYRRALKAVHRFIDLGLDHSSFEGLSLEHPSWKDRLLFLDREQAPLWRSMRGFSNGALFLTVEQYRDAEKCFRAVTQEFPDCFEGWANLGYARLMQYCDAMEPADIVRFNIGQFVCGAFYRRPKSLEAKVRGIDEDLWWQAVSALREALRLKPDLSLAKANLGLAMLVRPAGKDVEQATKLFNEAIGSFSTDEAENPVAASALLINAAVADLAADRHDPCAQKLMGAWKLLGGAELAEIDKDDKVIRLAPSHRSAILYNYALLLARTGSAEQRRKVVNLLQAYLQTTSATSAWWNVAYEGYRQLCSGQSLPVKNASDFARQTSVTIRPVTSVEIARGVSITLSEPTDEMTRRIGTGQSVPIQGTNLALLHYKRCGIVVLVSPQVIAVSLNEGSPPLPFTGIGHRKRLCHSSRRDVRAATPVAACPGTV